MLQFSPLFLTNTKNRHKSTRKTNKKPKSNQGKSDEPNDLRKTASRMLALRFFFSLLFLEDFVASSSSSLSSFFFHFFLSVTDFFC